MVKKLVSAIIPSYNSAVYIKDAIESILSQTYKNIEILIVDDGSIDNTRDVVVSYEKLYPGKVRYLSQKNQGPGIARNNGIANANGEYIAFLDADDMWEVDKIKVQVESLESSETMHISHTDFVYMYKGGIIKPSEYSNKKKKNFSGDIFFSLFRENFIRTSTVMIKKDTFNQAGGFDPDLFMSEDYDLWLRITKGRSVVSYIDKPLLKVRLHESHMTGDAQRTYMWVNKVIEKSIASSSDMADKLKSHLPYRLAKNHYTIGYKFFCDKKMAQARSEFIKSLRYKFKLSSVAYYLATFIDPKIVNFLKSMKAVYSRARNGRA